MPWPCRSVRLARQATEPYRPLWSIDPALVDVTTHVESEFAAPLSFTHAAGRVAQGGIMAPGPPPDQSRHHLSHRKRNGCVGRARLSGFIDRLSSAMSKWFWCEFRAASLAGCAARQSEACCAG